MEKNELLNELNKIHESKTQKEIEKAFNEIAKKIFYEYVLVVGKQNYRITEIEFYYYDKCIHPDPYVHCNEIQEKFGEWYFHRYKESDKLKVGNYKGLDITFGKGKACKIYGGILIRAIEKYDDTNEYTEGPCNVVKQILEEFSINEYNKKEYNKFLKEIEKHDIFENNKIIKKINLISLSSSEKKNDIVYKCPRNGLSIKSNPDSHWEEYIMKPYRYLLWPKKTKKGRDLLILGLLHENHKKDFKNADSIINKFNKNENHSYQNFNKSAIEKYESAFQFGVDLKIKSLPSDIEEYLFKYPKCILYGLLNEGDTK